MQSIRPPFGGTIGTLVGRFTWIEIKHLTASILVGRFACDEIKVLPMALVTE
jgi:hypothetical protein